jgi:hypothetical protein
MRQDPGTRGISPMLLDDVEADDLEAELYASGRSESRLVFGGEESSSKSPVHGTALPADWLAVVGQMGAVGCNARVLSPGACIVCWHAATLFTRRGPGRTLAVCLAARWVGPARARRGPWRAFPARIDLPTRPGPMTRRPRSPPLCSRLAVSAPTGRQRVDGECQADALCGHRIAIIGPYAVACGWCPRPEGCGCQKVVRCA